MSEVDELDFTIEFNSDLQNREYEADLMGMAERRLRELAEGHDDLIGAAVTIRIPAKETTPPLYEATIAAYVRPEQIAAREKADSPDAALDGALEAVERQVREKRAKLKRRWERPGNDPVAQEVAELVAAEQMDEIDIPDATTDS